MPQYNKKTGKTKKIPAGSARVKHARRDVGVYIKYHYSPLLKHDFHMLV
jgi:hypothetical protein